MAGEIQILRDQPPPPSPTLRLSLGVTGHRRGHASYPKDDRELCDQLASIFAAIAHHAKEFGSTVPARLHTLLADGADQQAAAAAHDLGWELCAPLPFGRLLNRAISVQPATLEHTRRILAGDHPDEAEVATRLDAIEAFEQRGCLFEIAEQDAQIESLLLRHVSDPGNMALANRFAFETARRYALGGRVLVEQSDLLVAVWDGESVANIGGTGHTVREALHNAVPVLRIDPADPSSWSILTSSEMLAHPAASGERAGRDETLRRIVEHALGHRNEGTLATLGEEIWRPQSSASHHAYRRVEALFGRQGLSRRFARIRQRYENPDEIAAGSASPVLESVTRMSPDGADMAKRINASILAPFAWADGISTFLSDRYRSGMIVNFVLGSIAIIAGVLYLPLGGPEKKWIFAAVELVTLLVIVMNTWAGGKRNLHVRWFTTRRVAEYLRQRPLLLAAGVARPTGRWPSGPSSDWPELYARMAVRQVSLPHTRVTEPFLRDLLTALHDLQVRPQAEYHRGKSELLHRVHHALDRASEFLFLGAILAVSAYLVLAGAQALGAVPHMDLVKLGKWFTVAGVAFPTIGGALAGIRYFGDFERFADISQVAGRRLEEVAERIRHLQAAPAGKLEFSDVADLLRTTDEIVFDELENWQAVFSAKRIAVPV